MRIDMKYIKVNSTNSDQFTGRMTARQSSTNTNGQYSAQNALKESSGLWSLTNEVDAGSWWEVCDGMSLYFLEPLSLSIAHALSYSFVFFLGQVKLEEKTPVSSVEIQRGNAESLIDHDVHLMDKNQVILATTNFG